MYTIYNDATKRSFKYDQNMKQLQQSSAHECELIMRLLIHQDAISIESQFSLILECEKHPSHYTEENQLVSSDK